MGKYSDSIKDFVNILSDSKLSLFVIEEAFACVAKECYIARIELICDSQEGPMVLYGKSRTDSESLPFYKEEFSLEGENKVIFCAYCEKELAKDSLPGKEYLDFIFQIFSVYLERHQLTAIMKKKAMKDYQTGLPNSIGFLAYLNELKQNGPIDKFTVFYFNLRRFGLLNHRFGYAEGNAIINRYADKLLDFVRGEEFVGRLGGDNFVALIETSRAKEFLAFLANVETFAYQGDEKIPVSISAVAGVVEIEDSMNEAGKMLSRSGLALSIAKNMQKVPYVYYTEELNAMVYRRKQLTSEFRPALENREFLVYYQPKVELDSFSLCGVEALVRWKRAGEILAPGEFIPIFEEDGLICQLDFYVLEQVCKDIKEWLERGIDPERVSVNFSRKHLSNPNFADHIVEILQKYDIESKYIEVEVTETAQEEKATLYSFVEKVKASGITVSIDDFGSGYSSFGLLRNFSVDIIKVDKTFIDNESLSEKDIVVLENIINMVNSLGMSVLTEGVEKWEQVKLLQDMGCNQVQGFLFDKPMPKEQIEEKFKVKQYDMNKIGDLRK